MIDDNEGAEMTMLARREKMSFMGAVPMINPPMKRTDGGETPVLTTKNAKAALIAADRAGGMIPYCQGCGLDDHTKTTKLLTVDHIRPKSEGGAWAMHNLQLMCSECNSRKGPHTTEWLRDRNRKLDKMESDRWLL